jgi:hypothetical protein
MAENQSPMIDGPVAGMAMAAELGNRPWQKPPKYATVEEALEFYLPRLTEPQVYDQLLDVMELGIPLTTIAESMQIGAVMEGMHTIDVGILVMPVLIEMMAYIGDDADIEYNLGMEERIDEDKISESTIALAMKKVRARLPEEVEEVKEEVADMEPAEQAEEMPAELSGLMARRT